MILFGIRHKALKLCCCLKKCNEIFGSWIFLVWQIISVNSYLVWRLAAADISAGVEREICGARLLRERFLLCPFSAPTLSHCIASFSFRIPPPLFLQKTPRSHSAKIKLPSSHSPKKNHPSLILQQLLLLRPLPFSDPAHST